MRIVFGLLLALFLALPCYATKPTVESDGTVSISSGANTIYLDNGTGVTAYQRVIVWSSPGASTAYINVNPAVASSSSDALLGSGASLMFGMAGRSAPTNSVNYYGNGTTGTISWMAW